MKAPTLLVTAIILLLILQLSSRGQSPSIQTVNARLLHCGWNLSSSDQCCYSPADSNSGAYDANSISRCGPCTRQDNYHPVPPAARSDRPEFVYRMTLTNDSAKIIRSIEWEYVFSDPEAQAEVARHHFYSEQRVRPKESKTLVEYSISPPTKVISITALSRPEPDRFVEKIILKQIVYEDGSVWVSQPQPR